MKKNILTLSMLLLNFIPAKSQYTIDVKNVDSFKNGTIYMLVDNLSAPEIQPYIDAFKNGWNYNKKVEVINKSDQVKYYSPENTFVELSSETEMVDNPGRRGEGGIFTEFYMPKLRFWYINPKFFTKKRKFNDDDKIFFADVYMHINVNAFYGESPKFDMCGNEKFYFWGPGILKNMSQTISNHLNNKISRKSYEKTKVAKELASLKQQKLFIPDNTLYSHKALGHRQEKNIQVTELLKKYPYPYELISVEKLNDKILKAETFYYLQFIQSKDNIYLNVINSKNGEIIYSTYLRGYELKKGDLKDIASEIK